jgi:hypothetical protein
MYLDLPMLILPVLLRGGGKAIRRKRSLIGGGGSHVKAAEDSRTPRPGGGPLIPCRALASWGFGFRAGVLSLTLAFGFCAFTRAAGPVYETATEFLTSGDFNGDGFLDVLVLDKTTGNARVGFQDGSSNLVWSAALPTGVPSPTALAIGHFRDTNQDAIAITSPDLNRVQIFRLSDASNAPSAAILTPRGVGPNFLVGVPAPYGVLSNFDSLTIGSVANNSGNSNNPVRLLLELIAVEADALFAALDALAEEAYLSTGNSVFLGSDPQSYIAAILRHPNTNDSFAILSPSNHFGAILTQPGLAAGSTYTFGTFNHESLPRFIFYVPGQSNLNFYSIVSPNGSLIFDSGISVSLSEPIQNVFYVSTGSDGVAVVVFGDGIQGVRVPGGSVVLSPIYRSGRGASGNTFSGVIPLSGGNFVLLDGPAGNPSSAHEQLIHFNGSSFNPVNAGSLPPLTTHFSRSDVWLFQAEPFISNNPGFVSSLNAPDWSSSPTIISSEVNVIAETDGGSSSGLGNPSTSDVGAAPAGTAWAMADQYRDFISIFSYASARPPEAVSVTISPPAGLYGGPIQVSFATSHASEKVFYRLNTNANYQDYTFVPFAVTNDVAIQYYGSNKVTRLRSRLYTAAYAFGRGGSPPPLSPIDIAPGTTNPAPVFQTNKVILSDIGTIFYGRRSSNSVGTIWAINLDGSGETFITTGARPRVSGDGKWMAFLREGDPFNNKGNIWLRNIATGLENRLFVSNPNPGANTNSIVCYDWDLSETNLVFDYDTTFWQLRLDGSFSQFPLAGDYNQGAPVVNPADGTVAFHVLYPGASGLYLSPPSLASKNFILGYPTGPLWPAWSPDGEYLALANGPVSSSVDGGKDLWVAEMNGGSVSNLFQITALSSGDAFPHGALWSPEGNALVGAGTIFGTNGIWIIPLSTDCMCSDDPIIRLPTAPGDPIDFVGSIITAPANQGSVQPGLFIRSDPASDSLIVYWSAAYLNFTLETTFDLAAPITWTEIPAPYAFDDSGYFNQYTIPISSLLQKQFFRLHYTGMKR